jgi:hypothetical protein
MRELTQAEMEAIDERPSYGSRSGQINYMRSSGVIEKRSRQVPPWRLEAARRRYGLQLMQARLEMEEVS